MREIKKLLTIIVLVAAVSMGYAQTDVSTAAGEITSELKFPTRKEAGKKELHGKYTFVVELDGTLSNIAVKDSMGYGMDAAFGNERLESACIRRWTTKNSLLASDHNQNT